MIIDNMSTEQILLTMMLFVMYFDNSYNKYNNCGWIFLLFIRYQALEFMVVHWTSLFNFTESKYHPIQPPYVHNFTFH